MPSTSTTFRRVAGGPSWSKLSKTPSSCGYFLNSVMTMPVEPTSWPNVVTAMVRLLSILVSHIASTTSGRMSSTKGRNLHTHCSYAQKTLHSSVRFFARVVGTYTFLSYVESNSEPCLVFYLSTFNILRSIVFDFALCLSWVLSDCGLIIRLTCKALILA